MFVGKHVVRLQPESQVPDMPSLVSLSDINFPGVQRRHATSSTAILEFNIMGSATLARKVGGHTKIKDYERTLVVPRTLNPGLAVWMKS